jgi:hypothetical protein
MEMALREAMEKSRSRQDETAGKGKRKPGSNQEMEKILSRTLEHKVKTASK